jgi:hypothetical protein
MEKIEFKDLLEKIHLRTNDGRKSFTIIDGVYKGNSVIYNIFADQWTLVIKKPVIIVDNGQRLTTIFSREII